MTAHFESSAVLAAPPGDVFAYVDDPTHLAAHMAKPSWTMAGGCMHLVLDEGQGREIGARIRLAGRVLGFDIATRPDGSLLRVFIEYGLPATLAGRGLGKLFGRMCARWCTERMVRDAARHFAQFEEKR